MSQELSPLPLAIVSEEGLDEIARNLKRTRERIHELEKQSAVFALADFFKKEPELESFSFKFYDSGRSAQFAGVKVNGHPANHILRKWDEDDPTEEALSRLSDRLGFWLNSKSEGDIVALWEGREIARPTDPGGLVEGLMSQCLGPKSYALWQAGALALTTPSAHGGLAKTASL